MKYETLPMPQTDRIRGYSSLLTLLKAAGVELNIYRFIDFIWVFTFAIMLNDFDAKSC